MKKVIALGIAVATLIKAREIHAEGWFKKAHVDIVEQAFEILKNDSHKDLVSSLEIFKDQLVVGACVPDVKGDCDNGSGLHYYSPKNKFGLPNRKNGDYYPNRLGGYSKSAGTIFEECYYTALILWQNKKYNTAAVMLGRALHFLSDMCCVPHTTSRVCTGNPKNCHMAFETYANKFVGIYNAMTSKSFYESYLSLSPIEIANSVSELSAGFYEKLTSKKDKNYDEIIAVTYPFSQMVVAGMIYKFAYEAKGEKLIDEFKSYVIKNCETGNFLHADGTTSDEPEYFKVKANHNGSLSFETQEGFPLTISLKFTQFRLTLKDENTRSFRITCRKKFSRNIAEIPLIRVTTNAFYKPDLDLHHWTIRETEIS
ncbi:MAG: zinc dependent phospholipase C family protein [Oscillospiraceae bacterium]|nr:zinc dependent phospholipase C family protein [Oscillospiraceae bacterium]